MTSYEVISLLLMLINTIIALKKYYDDTKR